MNERLESSMHGYNTSTYVLSVCSFLGNNASHHDALTDLGCIKC
jgi:hypothetical protein